MTNCPEIIQVRFQQYVQLHPNSNYLPQLLRKCIFRPCQGSFIYIFLSYSASDTKRKLSHAAHKETFLASHQNHKLKPRSSQPLSTNSWNGFLLYYWPYINKAAALHFRLAIYRVFPQKNYSGRKLTRFGRWIDLRFLISFAVTLHESNVSDFRFFSGLRYCNPAPVMREFEAFKETNCVIPALKKVKYMSRKGKKCTRQKDQIFGLNCH